MNFRKPSFVRAFLVSISLHVFNHRYTSPLEAFITRLKKEKTMKIKLLALSIMCATVALHGEQIKVPLAQVIYDRLQENTNELRAIGGDSRQLGLIFKRDAFYSAMTGKELDSSYVAQRLRGVALALVGREALFEKKRRLYLEHGIDSSTADNDASIVAQATLSTFVGMKIVAEEGLGKVLYGTLGGSTNKAHVFYGNCVKWLYSVFFRDYPEVLREELEKLEA